MVLPSGPVNPFQKRTVIFREGPSSHPTRRKAQRRIRSEVLKADFMFPGGCMANPKPPVPLRQSNTGFVHTLPVLLVQGETHKIYFHFIIFFIENIGEYIHKSFFV